MNLTDQQLIASAFEGALDEKAFRRLQERLAREPDLLELYREHALLHHSLCEEFEGREMIGRSLSAPTRPASWMPVLAAVAAAVVIVFTAWQVLLPSRPDPVIAGCEVSADGIATVDGSLMSEGIVFPVGSRLSVERGWVRLNLPRQAVALVEAPAVVVFEAEQVLRFESGRGRFHCPASARGFTVKGGSLVAVDHGTDFGIVSRPGGKDELHVFDGEVAVNALSGNARAVLRKKEAAAIDRAGGLQRMPAREEDFESLTPEVRVMLEDRFEGGGVISQRVPRIGNSRWRLEKGSPELKGGHLEGSGFEAYFWLPPDGLSLSRPILLVTVETTASPAFHTADWAGFSLYQEGYEHAFFGDSYGPEETWSLDVKRRFVPVLPSPLLPGPRTMTLRYDRRDGTIELHEGQEPGANPVVRSKIQPGLNFDQIRMGAAEGATLGVIAVRVSAVAGLAD